MPTLRYDDTVRMMCRTVWERNPGVRTSELAAGFGIPDSSFRYIVATPLTMTTEQRGLRDKAVALYPLFTQKEICERFHLNRNTLRNWLWEAGKTKKREKVPRCERCRIVVEGGETLCEDCVEKLEEGQLFSEGEELPLERIIELIGEQSWMTLETGALPSG